MKRKAKGTGLSSPDKGDGQKKKRKGVGHSNDISSFFKSPQSKTSQSHTEASKTKEKTIISLLSSSDEDVPPVTSTSTPGPASSSSSRLDMQSKSKAHTLGAVANGHTDDNDTYPLDLDIFQFDPLVHVNISTWSKRKDAVQVPYAFLVAAFVMISSTKSRLVIVTILTNTLRSIATYQPEALLQAVYLITNHVAPAYEGVELGIGSQVLSKSLKDVSGTTAKQLKSFWNQHGDFGDVAFAAKSAVRTLIPTARLTITTVYNDLLKICALKGAGVTAQKSAIVTKLLVAAKGEEVRFLARTLVAHLRIGAVRLTVTAALARCFCLLSPESSAFSIPEDTRKGVRAVARTVKEGKDDPRRQVLVQKLMQAEALVRRVYVRHPNYDDIVPALLSVGLDGLEAAVPLSVGTPLCNMLGQITRNLSDVSNRLQADTEFACEYKYDGQRVQIHARYREQNETITSKGLKGLKGGTWIGEHQDIYVRLFSRHLEDMTTKYPDILALIPQLLSRENPSDNTSRFVESFVMDAEIVAIDGETGALQNFQTLSNRARKDVDLGNVKIKAKIFSFDLMHLNGRSLLTETFRTRRQLLLDHFLPRDPPDASIARFGHVQSMLARNTPDDMDHVSAFMTEAIASKCEGLMIKILDHEFVAPDMLPKPITRQEESEDESDMLAADDTTRPRQAASNSSPGKHRRKLLLSSYEPDKRADSWMKVKKDYSEMGGDSLDLVPIAAWHGQGRKAGWWSPLLLAVYDPKRDVYSAVCKCISGFTDQFYKDLNERYPKDSETCSKLPFVQVETGLIPDWYFKPSEVWELRGADITLSPVYPASKGLIAGSDRGLSLRFPRFMKLRQDKSTQEATTPEALAEAYYRQESGGHKEQKIAARVEDIASDIDEEEDKYEEEVLLDFTE